jgi:hypothetical protein
MAGLNYGMGLGTSATANVKAAAPSQPQTIAQAAYGPGATAPVPKTISLLSPGRAFGLAFWTQVGCVVGLIILRHSLRGKGK